MSAPIATSAERERRTLAMSFAAAVAGDPRQRGGVVGDAGVEDRGLAEGGLGGGRDGDRGGDRDGARSRAGGRLRDPVGGVEGRGRGRVHEALDDDGGDHAADEQAHDGAEAHQGGRPPDRDAHDQARAAGRALRRAVVQRPRAGRAVEDVRVRLADRELRRTVRSLAGQPAAQEIEGHPAECGRRAGRCTRPEGPETRRDVRSAPSARTIATLVVGETEYRQAPSSLLACRGHGCRSTPCPSRSIGPATA